jgi:hypothetical protein
MVSARPDLLASLSLLRQISAFGFQVGSSLAESIVASPELRICSRIVCSLQRIGSDVIPDRLFDIVVSTNWIEAHTLLMLQYISEVEVKGWRPSTREVNTSDL